VVLDKCATYFHLDSTKNTELEFPPNVTSLVQLIDMGIINNFKTLCHSEVRKLHP
jgi:hypothetical protein